MAQDWRTLKLEVLAETGQFIKEMNQANAKTQSFGDKLRDFGKNAAVAFGAAAAAAGAYATKLAIDGVKAAVEDTAAQARLAQALKATTGATEAQIVQTEQQINKLSLATGVADDELRPAFQRLSAATGSLEESQKSLQLALDISARTGKDVQAVANALGKAYEGNTGALARLGIGLSTAEMKSLGLEGTMQKLSDLMGGAAATQAKTLEGQMAVLRNRFNEAKETVGLALLPTISQLLTFFNERLAPGIEKIANGFGGPDGLGARVKNFITQVSDFLNPVLDALRRAFDKVSSALIDNKSNFKDVLDFFKTLYEFFNKFIIPILKTSLVAAIEGIATAFSLMIKVVSPIIGTLADLLSNILRIVDRVISAIKNLFDGGLLSGLGNLAGRLFSQTAAPSIPQGPGIVQPFRPNNGLTIQVNAPSIIDETGFTRAVVDAFNSVERRNGGGASAFQYV